MAARPDRYYFSIGAPILSLVLGFPVTALFLWAASDPSLYPGSDDPLISWLAAQSAILPRLFFLGLAVFAFDGLVLDILLPYRRSRTALEFTPDFLIVNGKYGQAVLPRKAFTDVYKQNRWIVIFDVAAKYKQRSWYGWRVNPALQTGNVAGLKADELLEQFRDWW